MQKFIRVILTLNLLAVILAACQSEPASPTIDVNSLSTQAFETALAALQPTTTPVSTETPLPTATVVRTPPALPGAFVASQLNPLDTPHTYIEDTCKYLHDKWDSDNAAPGKI